MVFLTTLSTVSFHFLHSSSIIGRSAATAPTYKVFSIHNNIHIDNNKNDINFREATHYCLIYTISYLIVDVFASIHSNFIATVIEGSTRNSNFVTDIFHFIPFRTDGCFIENTIRHFHK